MDLNKLPFVPMNFFYYQFSSGAQKLFLALMTVLVLGVGLFLFSYHNPWFWSVSVQEVAESQSGSVKIADVATEYRNFDIAGTAYKQWVNFTASPVMPHTTPLILFWIFQVLGWATILTAATQIRSRWYLFFFFLFGLFIHFSQVALAFYPNDTYHLLELGIGLVFLGLGYTFQQYTLKWAFPYRFLIFLSFLLLLFGGAWMKNGSIELHGMSVTLYPYLAVLGALLLFFLGKEPTNLLIFGATNHKDIENRRSLPQILALFAILVVWNILNLLASMHILPSLNWGIRPVHVLGLSLLLTVFLSQNQFHVFKHYLTSVQVYTFVLLGWVIIVTGFWFGVIASGDVVFAHVIEDIATTFFTFIGLGHLLYLMLDFRPLLKNKVNVYYLIGQGRGLMVTMMFLVGLIGFVFVEGLQHWAEPKLMVHTYYVNRGDHAFMKKDMETANAVYNTAILVGVNSPKPNHNLGAIAALNNDLQGAMESYERATSMHYFPFSTLNAGNLLALKGDTLNAKRVWLYDFKNKHNAYISNNLSSIYLHQKKVDSAIICLKSALKEKKNMSAGYSNLAEVYWENKMPKQAKAFTQTAIGFSKPSPAAITNAIWHVFNDTLNLEIPKVSVQQAATFELTNNYALYMLRNQNHAAANQWFREIEKSKLEGMDQLQTLIAYEWFMQDSVAKAMSKADYIASLSNDASAQAYYLMGVGFYQKGVPEMAQMYFKKMAAVGDTSGYFYEGLMYADRGMVDSAYLKLSALRVAYPTFEKKIAKELAMMDKSRGIEMAARANWDFVGITLREKMRIGRYADSSAHFGNAMQVYGECVREDSLNVLPYIETVSLYRKYKNPEALTNGEYALKKFPENEKLKNEVVRTYLAMGKVSEAQKLLSSIKMTAEDTSSHFDTKLLQAQLLLAQKDTAKAIPLLESLQRQRPLRQDVFVDLAQAYRTRKLNEKGYNLVYNVLKTNTENADIWYYYAYFVKFYGFPGDARVGIINCLSRLRDENRKNAIVNEFKEVLFPQEETEEKAPEVLEEKDMKM